MYESGDIEILAVEVDEDARTAGMRAHEVELLAKSRLVADVEANEIGNPNTLLEAGDRYLLAVRSDVAEEVVSLFRE